MGISTWLRTGMILAITSGAANAATLGLSKVPPDLLSTFIQVDYNAASGHLSATGFPDTLNVDGIPADEITGLDGNWDLEANFDAGGDLLGGTLSITVNGLAPFPNGTNLAVADLQLFAFTNLGTGTFFEFISQITSTGVSPLVPIGAKLGTILSLGATNDFVDFAHDFHNNSFDGAGGFADTFLIPATSVPTPGAASGVLVGMAAMLIKRRRK